MPEFVTFGETMAVFVPESIGSLRYSKTFSLEMAGAESNTAIGIAKLGHTSGWISALGCDELGDYVISAIRAEGVDTSCVLRDEKHRTGLMIKQFSADETEVFYYRDKSAASFFGAENISYEYLKNTKIIHLTGITPVLSENCMDTVATIADFAKKYNILLSFDVNIRKKLWKGKDYSEMISKLLFTSDIALLGLDEAELLLKIKNPEEIIRCLLSQGVKMIALKDGANGAIVANKDSCFKISPQRCKPIDPIGAGDGFNAGFLAGVLEKRDLKTCGTMGAIAGAMATETKGDVTGYPSKKRMEQRLLNEEKIYR